MCKFIYHVYNIDHHSFSQVRVEQLINTPDVNMKMLAPPVAGLLQHIKRSCIQAGYLWKLCEFDMKLPNFEQFGWKKRNKDSFAPVWQEDDVYDILSILKTCSCKEGLCSNCSCQKSCMSCFTYCKCIRDKCTNHWYFVFNFKTIAIICNLMTFISWFNHSLYTVLVRNNKSPRHVRLSN